MSKEHFMAAHEALVEEYLDEHPEATWEQAYSATADGAYNRMRDRLADMADDYRQRRKEGLA
jgi:hypothetical protein